MPQFSPQNLTQSPQSIADFFTQSLGTPGVLVSVSDGIRTASVANGLNDIEEESPLHHTQHFKIGSQTKMMTGLVVLELAEEGLIDLDRPLSDYVDPALIAGVANADLATVRQALQMKTGIANYTSAERPDGTTAIGIIAENPDEVFGGEEIVALLQGLPATAAVGVEYEYSNTNYFYLSKVIEAVTGQDLGKVFHERIFAPLGMENTYLEDFRDNPDLVSTYLEFDGELIDTSELLVDAHGEGGVISTAADMTTFLNALLVEQTLTSDTVLAALTDFETGSQDPRGFIFNNGLGLFDYEGVGTFVGFSGAIYGSDTATFLHLETGRIISTMVNLGNGSATGTGGVISTAATLIDDETWQQDLQGEQLVIDGISAADLHIDTQDGASVLTSDGASLRLPDHISEFDSDTFVFTDGSALLIGSAAGDRLRATSGDDQIRGFGGDDRLIGGQGNDSANGGDGADQLEGGAGDDTLNGDEGNDTLRGNDGADDINGGAGDDVVFAGNDNDTVTGGLGDDSLSGSGGADLVQGDEGADTLSGENGDDELLGGVGSDVLIGGNGADTINGGNDADMLFGNAGADSMLGGMGNDTLNGDQQNDILFGEDGNDVLRGGDGFDTLDGGDGADQLVGGNGRDVMRGGLGIDTLIGEAGDDTFDFNDVAETSFAAQDVIVGMSDVGIAGGDRIDLADIDADTSTEADDAFVFLGNVSNATGLAAGPGSLWVVDFGTQTRVFGTTDGASVDLAIRINDGAGTMAADYIVDDFLL